MALRGRGFNYALASIEAKKRGLTLREYGQLLARRKVIVNTRRRAHEAQERAFQRHRASRPDLYE